MRRMTLPRSRKTSAVLNTHRNTTRKIEGGFTLIETLVALALVTIISLVVMGALSPRMGFKQKMDTERRMQDIRQGLASLYTAKAMTIDKQSSGQFDLFRTSTLANSLCAAQLPAFEATSDYFSESPNQLARDGYANPWCIWVTAPLMELRDGVQLWYRNIILVSTGLDGVLDATTKVLPDGTLTTGGDDTGITVSGREIQYAKLQETLRRMNKVSQMYETYFTTRYLANASRDITVYYFSQAFDSAGLVASSGGTWSATATTLASIGVGASDAMSAWELDNSIDIGNATESLNGVTVRSPASSGTGALPYTALLRARVPAPPGQTPYAVQVVVGNY